MHVTDGAQAFGLDICKLKSKICCGIRIRVMEQAQFCMRKLKLFLAHCMLHHAGQSINIQQRKNEWVFSKLKQIWQCKMAQK